MKLDFYISTDHFVLRCFLLVGL